MDRAKLLEILPYGEVFLWLDHCSEIEAGTSIRGRMTYKPENPFLAAHFAAGPKIVPGCLITEQICQAALVLATTSGHMSKKAGYLVGRVQAVFERPAVMPCTICCDVSVKETAMGVLAIEGIASVAELGQIARVRALASPIPTPCVPVGIASLGDSQTPPNAAL